MINELAKRMRAIEGMIVDITKELGDMEINQEFLDAIESVEFAIENLNEELEY